MTRAMLKKALPMASESFLQANATDVPKSKEKPVKAILAQKNPIPEAPWEALTGKDGFLETYAPNPPRYRFENGEWVRVFPEKEDCSTIKPNPDYVTVPKGETLDIVISGQIRGGKNNQIVLRSGIHIPKKEWARWRDHKVVEVKAQLPKDWQPIDQPVNYHLKYVAGDKRRRDLPAICDSIFHILEKAGVVADDTFLWMTASSRDYDKENPRAELTLFLP